MLGLLRRKKKKDDDPVDLEERSLQLGLQYRDMLTLRHLVANGADLDEPRHVLYFLYIPTQEGARACADRATQAGWQVEAKEPLPDHPDWTVVCEQQAAITTPEFIRDATDFFEGLAEELGGKCDGWEASV